MWEWNGPPAEISALQAYPHAIGDRHTADKYLANTVCQMVSSPDPKPCHHLHHSWIHLSRSQNKKKGGTLYFKRFYFSLNRSLNIIPKLKKMRGTSSSQCLWGKSELCLSCKLYCWAGHSDRIESNNKNWDVAHSSFVTCCRSLSAQNYQALCGFRARFNCYYEGKVFSHLFSGD